MKAAMRILLSDGAGLTARQCATLLSLAGHEVEAVCAEPLCLCRFTRHVRHLHRVPPCGADLFGWLDATLEIASSREAEVLLPVQEQAAVIALAQDRIRAAGLATAVPSFGALAQVQDKVSAFRTLRRLGLPQPPAYIADSASALVGPFPAFAKTPIGTASAGVFRVTTEAGARALAAHCDREGVFASGGLLVQQPAAGPLVMVQGVFGGGSLTAFHACEQVRQGVGGGSSHKRGLRIPRARRCLESLGGALGWHGALSADLILTPEGPVFIDVNPRLVEPVNAARSGVDLVGRAPFRGHRSRRADRGISGRGCRRHPPGAAGDPRRRPRPRPPLCSPGRPPGARSPAAASRPTRSPRQRGGG
jgi:biotin carboxylase